MLPEESEALQRLKKEENRSMGPGSRLGKIREARHISLEEMAKRLCLTRERLLQIERDDYQLMGASAFAKGYLRSYASQLDLVEEELLGLLQAFDDLNLSAQIRRNKPELLHEKIDQGSTRTSRWVAYFLLVLLVGFTAYLWRNHLTSMNKVLNTEKSTETAESPTTPSSADSTSSAAPPFTDQQKNISHTDTKQAPSPQDTTPDASDTQNRLPAHPNEKFNPKKIKLLAPEE